MAKILSNNDPIGKDIERLKKRIEGLNDAISLQANKIGNTSVLIIIAREEKILQNQIMRKKTALQNLADLKKKRLQARNDD